MSGDMAGGQVLEGSEDVSGFQIREIQSLRRGGGSGVYEMAEMGVSKS